MELKEQEKFLRIKKEVIKMIENKKEKLKENNIKIDIISDIMNDEENYYILDFEGDKNYIFSKISQAARNYLGNMYLDMLPYEDDFARNSVQNHKTFYSKNK